MTRILDKLEEEGLVRRVYLEADRRRVDVHLTRRGAELADASFSALYAAESSLLGSLGKERCEAIASSFDALSEAFAARGDPKRPAISANVAPSADRTIFRRAGGRGTRDHGHRGRHR
jgi:hypothetical protein